MVVIDDTSEKVFNERLKELNNYKDDLISTISHNLKTPLNGIIGSLRRINRFENQN